MFSYLLIVASSVVYYVISAHGNATIVSSKDTEITHTMTNGVSLETPATWSHGWVTFPEHHLWHAG